MNRHAVNPALLTLDEYASKAIATRAKADPNIANLSFGEPDFGPPQYLIDGIEKRDLNKEAFLDSVKRYEISQGSLALRKAISNWYNERYGLAIDPEKEIIVTHGGVEAITLAILSVTSPGDAVSVTNPSYMLYQRTVAVLGRQPVLLARRPSDQEYSEMLKNAESRTALEASGALIVNSPENPTGYVLDAEEWDQLGQTGGHKGPWVIHDEVYDALDFGRVHKPARATPSLAPRSILVNSFSKKFGVPGLRIGWMIADESVINMAQKVHDYLYLGVNIQYESVATRLLEHPGRDEWLVDLAEMLRKRTVNTLAALSEIPGISWPRKPNGAMFAFPNVSGIYEQLPASYKKNGVPAGDIIAQYWMEEKKVAVVPGSVCGSEGDDYVRMVLCTAEADFEKALQRLQG